MPDTCHVAVEAGGSVVRAVSLTVLLQQFLHCVEQVSDSTTAHIAHMVQRQKEDSEGHKRKQTSSTGNLLRRLLKQIEAEQNKLVATSSLSPVSVEDSDLCEALQKFFDCLKNIEMRKMENIPFFKELALILCRVISEGAEGAAATDLALSVLLTVVEDQDSCKKINSGRWPSSSSQRLLPVMFNLLSAALERDTSRLSNRSIRYRVVVIAFTED